MNWVQTNIQVNEEFRYMKIHIFALRWRDEIRGSSQLRTLLKLVEHLFTNRSSLQNWENLTAKIMCGISGSTFRVCFLIKKSVFRNPEKDLTILLLSATILIEKFECGRRKTSLIIYYLILL